MKHLIKQLFRNFGFDIIRYKKEPDKIEYKRSVKTDALTYYETITGNFYLPKDAPNDVVANTIINGDIFEKEVVELGYKYIKEGSTVLDVGANFGQMSILFAKAVGDNGKVYSFDADDFVFSILNKNIKANNLDDRIKTIFGAVHNVIGETLYFPEQDFIKYEAYGAYGIDYNAKEGRKLSSITIDSLNIEGEISFMKIDIQGGDLQAMQGAIKTIEKNRMPILFEYEYHFEEEYNLSFQQYVDFVDSINYKFQKVINGHNFLIVPKEHFVL
jgi:FkbM family methyltransferase